MKKIFLILLLVKGIVAFSQNDSVNKDVDLPEYGYTDTSYYSSGALQNVCYHTGDSVLLTKLSYYPSGALRSCLNYNRSRDFEGKIMYWYENGALESVSNFVNGFMVGDKNMSYYENGALESLTSCSNDTCKTTSYYASGKISGKTISQGPILLYIEKWCENGQLIYKDYTYQKQDNFYQYNCNGSVFVHGSKNTKGAFIGDIKIFWDNGNLNTVGSYLNHDGIKSIKQGVWKYYDENGKLVKTEKYDNGSLIKE